MTQSLEIDPDSRTSPPRTRKTTPSIQLWDMLLGA
jgi:hypothetical protein